MARNRVRKRWLRRIQLFERDGGWCRLCGDALNRHQKNREHPDYANIDHIVPVSRGGTNALDNLQLVHARCNSLKGSEDNIALIKGETE